MTRLLSILPLLLLALTASGQGFRGLVNLRGYESSAYSTPCPTTFMGVAITNTAADATSYTAVVTNAPPANTLVLVAVGVKVSSGSASVPTLTGMGMTWNQITNLSITAASTLTVFAGLTNGTATSDAIVADLGGVTHTLGLIRAVQLRNVNATTPVPEHAVTNMTGTGQTSGTMTLTGLAHNNVAIAFTSYAFNNDVSPEAGWTVDTHLAATGGLNLSTTHNLVGNDASFTATYPGDSWVGVLLEIANGCPP